MDKHILACQEDPNVAKNILHRYVKYAIADGWCVRMGRKGNKPGGRIRYVQEIFGTKECKQSGFSEHGDSGSLVIDWVTLGKRNVPQFEFLAFLIKWHSDCTSTSVCFLQL